jgi:hypothetical protein
MSELTPSCGSSETTRKASFSTEDFMHTAKRRMFRATGSFYNGLSDFEGDVALSLVRLPIQRDV